MPLHLLIGLWILAVQPHAFAMESGPEATDESTIIPEPPATLDLTGVVIDRTMTTFGRVFYTEFSKRWAETTHARTLVLIVDEKPSARTGSLVTITYQRDVLFRGFISPARSDIERFASMAVWESTRRAEIIERLKDGAGNPDLGKDEI